MLDMVTHAQVFCIRIKYEVMYKRDLYKEGQLFCIHYL